MRTLALVLLFATLTTAAVAAERPMAEEYLHSGKLKQGQKALKKALKESPDDDEIRFGLAVVQLVRGVERVGQTLHEYGVKESAANMPVLRIPVPKNDDPKEIAYKDFRRMLTQFQKDLAKTEATLTEITDDDVKLRLRLAEIHMDIDNDGEASDRFLDILRGIMRRQDFKFLEENPEFEVAFDRGDVDWLRAYTHLVMGMVDIFLSIESEDAFYLTADYYFAKPKRVFNEDEAARYRQLREAEGVLTHPQRLSSARKHFVQIAKLNHTSWKHIRAETDNDHEWLPHANQQSVLGLPVQDRMIDAWLAVMTEIERVLEGERTIPLLWYSRQNEQNPNQGLNLKILLEEPPERLNSKFFDEIPEKYITDDKHVDIFVLFRFFQIFNDSTAVGYAAWFN